jgi:hypothetical protein
MTYQETHEPGWVPPDGESQTGQTGAKEAVQSTAATVQSTAATVQESARDVASEVKSEARAVASEASDQARRLYATTKDELAGQAQAKTDQAAQGLRRLSDQVRALAEGRTQDAGQLTGYARDAHDRLMQFASRLEAGGPQGLLDDVSRFARRRPLVFIGACAGAGFLLTRFVRAGTSQDQPAAQQPVWARTTPSGSSQPSGALAEPAPHTLEGDGFTSGAVAQ